jgi:hypothetical protein
LAPAAERDGRKGARPSRSVPDTLPQPRAVRGEIRETVARLHALGLVYSVEHEALLALGSSEVSVTSGPGSMTEATVLDRENAAARRDAARAVAHLRFAAKHVELALGVFGPEAVQPERSPDSVVSESTFDKAVNRARHRQREEEMRRG